MAARKTVWDLEAGVAVEMWAVDADDAVKHDPSRYSFTPPDGRPTAVPIPPDWADLSGGKRRGLAMKLGAPNTIKVSEVDAFIEAELEKRDQAPAVAPVPPRENAED